MLTDRTGYGSQKNACAPVRSLLSTQADMRHLMFALGLLAAAASFGCSNNNNSSSGLTGPTPTVVTETFNGSIGQNGQMIHSFTITNSGYPLLAGFTAMSPSTITSLGVGIGSWDPTAQTCSLNQTQNDSAKLGSTAVSATAPSGSFCMRVYDGGNITDPSVTVTYTLQVEHY